MLGNCEKFNVTGVWYCRKIVRQMPDGEGFYKQHKEFGLYPEDGLQGSDMHVT